MTATRRGIRKREVPLHFMLIPGLVVTFVYAYLPIFGIIMAFQQFNPVLSFWGSPFIGLGNFRYIFGMPEFARVLRNTLVLSTAKIVAGLAVPLVLALLVNEVLHNFPKRAVQSAIFPALLPFLVGTGRRGPGDPLSRWLGQYVLDLPHRQGAHLLHGQQSVVPHHSRHH